jgi:DNA-binding NarL/FixJ family response regulator
VRNLRTLVVDDFEAFRRFICSTLEQSVGVQIIGQASDGLEAIQLAKKLQPDLILLDVGLPGLNGLEVARRVRAFAPAKFLFFSALADPDVVREAFNLGAIGYVYKPHAQSELLPAIDAARENRRFVGKGLEFSEDADTEATHRHEIHLCHDDATILRSFTHFIARALRAGNPAIVLATEPHRDGLLQQLRALGVRIDAAIEQGTYIALDADEPTDAVEFLQAIRSMSEAAAKAGKKYPRVAFCGERAGRLWAEGKKDESTQLEQLCEDLARAENVDVLCVYPLPQGQDEIPALDSIFAEHSAVSYR